MAAADDYPHLALMWFQGDEGYDQAGDALAEIDRLRAIEAAARAFCREMYGDHYWPSLTRLERLLLDGQP